MAGRPPDPDAPRPDDVRRSLRALADGSAPRRDPTDGTSDPGPSQSPSPDAVVRDAERAARCARDAVAFLSAGRLPDLDRAVATAARRGDDDLADRGRAARASLRRLDDALEGVGVSEPTVGGDAVHDGAGGRPEGPAREVRLGTDDSCARGDHFHSGHGTVLGDTAQGPDR